MKNYYIKFKNNSLINKLLLLNLIYNNFINNIIISLVILHSSNLKRNQIIWKIYVYINIQLIKHNIQKYIHDLNHKRYNYNLNSIISYKKIKKNNKN